MTIRCIDIETTGIDPENDAVVEIASVDILRGGAGSRTGRRYWASPG